MVNEVQRFDIGNSPGSGKFVLGFNGADTAPIQYHPAAGVVQSALEALPTVGIGNVVVTKDGNWGYVETFLNALGDQDLPQLTAVMDAQMAGTGATMTVATVQQGSSGDVPPDVPGGGSGPTLQTPCTVRDRGRCGDQRGASQLPG